MELLQEKYDSLQRSYNALLRDVAEKDKVIESLSEQNQKLQSHIDSFETALSTTGSLESGCSKESDYGKNLDIIAECVTNDELKFMEDLSREKDSVSASTNTTTTTTTVLPPRSSIMKKSHTDAEEEFFLLTVLSAKIDLATKSCSNAAVSDISPQSLWNRAQDEYIAMHQFHDWIMTELLKVYQNTQSESTTISHKWQSDGTILSIKEEEDQTPYGPYNSLEEDIDKVPPRDTVQIVPPTMNAVNAMETRFRVTPERTAKYMIRSSPQQMMEEEQILSEDSDAEDW